MLFLVAAAARPFWDSQLVPYEPHGRDLMVLFDVSKSMRATDIAPSRLEHAKFLLRQLVEADPGDRFGLVAFAGTAYLACPLTSDQLAFNQYIDELSTDTVPLGGTNLELALNTAMTAFKGGRRQQPGDHSDD
ncbi:MAG: VWA domain-containing protein [Lentisphaeria bacterium]|nr:MAG: VWA domain-containing protein [Lentisphaeria bacterium]